MSVKKALVRLVATSIFKRINLKIYFCMSRRKDFVWSQALFGIGAEDFQIEKKIFVLPVRPVCRQAGFGGEFREFGTAEIRKL